MMYRLDRDSAHLDRYVGVIPYMNETVEELEIDIRE